MNHRPNPPLASPPLATRPSQNRLLALLAVAWESEVVSARVLAQLADRMTSPRARARILVLSAFSRAHAARILGRISALGRVPIPVPPETLDLPSDLDVALARESHHARRSAARYQRIAHLARGQQDLATAWICELNQAEEAERARELSSLGASDEPGSAAIGQRAWFQ